MSRLWCSSFVAVILLPGSVHSLLPPQTRVELSAVGVVDHWQRVQPPSLQIHPLLFLYKLLSLNPGSGACPYATVSADSQEFPLSSVSQRLEKTGLTDGTGLDREMVVAADSRPHSGAQSCGQTVLGLSQGRIHSTDSTHPTPSALRQTAGGTQRDNRGTAGVTCHHRVCESGRTGRPAPHQQRKKAMLNSGGTWRPQTEQSGWQSCCVSWHLPLSQMEMETGRGRWAGAEQQTLWCAEQVIESCQLIAWVPLKLSMSPRWLHQSSRHRGEAFLFFFFFKASERSAPCVSHSHLLNLIVSYWICSLCKKFNFEPWYIKFDNLTFKTWLFFFSCWKVWLW